MGRIRHSRPALTAAAVFLCTGLSIAAMFLTSGRGVIASAIASGSWTEVMAMTSPLVFLCACVLVFFRPTLGYVLGGIAGNGCVALVCPDRIIGRAECLDVSEWSLRICRATSRPFSMLKILSVTLIATAVTCSFLRLLPSGLLLRNSPLSRRTWPAITVGVLVRAGWFAHSARPWMLPTIVDGPSPELRILHVAKRGLKFHETSSSLIRNGAFEISRRRPKTISIWISKISLPSDHCHKSS